MTADQPSTEPVRCQICGRKLQTPASRARGRGLTCDEKVNPTPGRDHSTRIRTSRRPAGRPSTAQPGQDGEPTLLDHLADEGLS